MDPRDVELGTGGEGRLTKNILDALPKSIQPLAERMLTEVREAEDRSHAKEAAGFAMAFNLIEAAEDRWRSVNGADLVALVRAGATFRKGVMVESEPQEGEVAA